MSAGCIRGRTCQIISTLTRSQLGRRVLEPPIFWNDEARPLVSDASGRTFRDIDHLRDFMLLEGGPSIVLSQNNKNASLTGMEGAG